MSVSLSLAHAKNILLKGKMHEKYVLPTLHGGFIGDAMSRDVSRLFSVTH